MTRSIAILAGVLLACGNLSGAQEDSNSTVRRDVLMKLQAEHRKPDEVRGLEIYRKQFLQDIGWHSLEVRLDMLLIDAAGRESRRKVIKREIEDAEVPDKTLG